jgi:hypothetical protein
VSTQKSEIFKFFSLDFGTILKERRWGVKVLLSLLSHILEGGMAKNLLEVYVISLAQSTHRSLDSVETK